MKRLDDIMRQSFRDSASSVMQSPGGNWSDQLLVGFEAEVSVVRREDLEPVSQELRDAIVADIGQHSDVELGAFQLELRTSPRDVLTDGLLGLCTALRAVDRDARRAAAARGATLLRCGFYPFPENFGRIERTNALKYQVVPAFHNENRGRWVNTLVGLVDPIDIGDASIIALANSVQFNLQAGSPSRAVALANRLLSVSPLLCAVGANARFLAGRDLGHADARMFAWERSHDTRDVVAFLANKPTRVGLPATYYESLEDYFDRVASFQFILGESEAAFQVGIGMYWNDVRIKFPNNRFVVEFRPLSVQPTAIEDVALFAATLGLAVGPDELLPLRPMDHLIHDRDAAFTRGLDANLHVWTGERWALAPARQAVADALAIARGGLESLGLSADATTFLPVLEQRLTEGTPSERLARDVNDLAGQGLTVPEALRTVLKANCIFNDEE